MDATACLQRICCSTSRHPACASRTYSLRWRTACVEICGATEYRFQHGEQNPYTNSALRTIGASLH
eukprot:2644257-Prymnesium_polylepis.2